VTADGGTVWKIVHPSVWATAERNTKTRDIVAPIKVADDWYYAIGPCLHALDVERGVILRREIFPSNIAALAAADGQLVVTVEYEDVVEPDTGTRTIAMTYNPELGAPRQVWDWHGIDVVWQDVTHLAPSIGDAATPVQPDQAEAAVAAIEKVRAQEPTNPFYDFFLAKHLQALGDVEAARKHFDAARDQPAYHWSGDVQLTAMFDAQLDFARADVVFSRALTRLDRDWALHTLSDSVEAYTILMGRWVSTVVPAAVDRKDFVAVDRAVGRSSILNCCLAGSKPDFDAMSDWFGENGRHDLRLKWRARAERISPHMPEQHEKADRGFLMLVSLLFGTLAAAIGAGLGARMNEERWWRRIGPGALAGIVLPIALSYPVTLATSAAVYRINAELNMPAQALTLSLGEPNTIEWLEARHPGDKRDELLRRSKETLAGFGDGTNVHEEPGVFEFVFRQSAEVTAAHGSWTVPGSPAGPRLPAPYVLVAVQLALAALLVVLGLRIRDSSPENADKALMFVPLGHTSERLFRGISSAFLVGMVLSYGIGLGDRLADGIEPPQEADFGLQGLQTATETADQTWIEVIVSVDEETYYWWLMFALLIGAHFNSVARYRLRETGADRDPGP
jgi:hypothetical protein